MNNQSPTPAKERPRFRVGHKVKLNVYEGDRPIFQCHTPEDAARYVALLNAAEADKRRLKMIRDELLSYDSIGFASGDREPNSWISPKKWLKNIDAALATAQQEEKS